MREPRPPAPPPNRRGQRARARRARCGHYFASLASLFASARYRSRMLSSTLYEPMTYWRASHAGGEGDECGVETMRNRSRAARRRARARESDAPPWQTSRHPSARASSPARARVAVGETGRDSSNGARADGVSRGARASALSHTLAAFAGCSPSSWKIASMSPPCFKYSSPARASAEGASQIAGGGAALSARRTNTLFRVLDVHDLALRHLVRLGLDAAQRLGLGRQLVRADREAARGLVLTALVHTFQTRRAPQLCDHRFEDLGATFGACLYI